MWQTRFPRLLSASLGVCGLQVYRERSSRPSSRSPCRCDVQSRRSADVLVIGGGITGVSTALYLAKAGSRVLLVEAESVGSGGTGMSCATVAAAGAGDGSKSSQSMTHWTVTALRDLQDRARAGEADVDCGFVECGVLELLRSEKELSRAKAEAEDLQSHGYNACVLSASNAQHVEPALRGAPGLLGALHLPHSGYADPCKTMQALASEARASGAEIWEGCKAVAADRVSSESGQRWSVDLSSSSGTVRLGCDHVVLATGASAEATGKTFGLSLPVARVKAQMWSAKTGKDAAKLSNIIYSMASHLFWAEHATRDDASGTPNMVTHSATGHRYCYHIYGRPSDNEEDEVFFGGDRLPLSLEQAPSDYQPDAASLEENFQHISTSLPSLQLQAAELGTWCGVVGSSLHGGVLVGEVVFLPGLWLCTGFGGSGFMKGIGAGKAISDWIIEGRDAANAQSFPVLRAEADPSPWVRPS